LRLKLQPKTGKKIGNRRIGDTEVLTVRIGVESVPPSVGSRKREGQARRKGRGGGSKCKKERKIIEERQDQSERKRGGTFNVLKG